MHAVPRREGTIFFFTTSIRSIFANFARLYKSDDEEDGNTEEETQRVIGPLEQYGSLPFILKFIEITHLNWNETMESPICLVLYLVCYSIDKAKMEELQIQQWKRTH